MQKIKIPFNKPQIFKDALNNFDKLKFYSSNGVYTTKCENWLKKNLNVKTALLVKSCTSALEMCALLLNLKKGDEIVMPSYTFVSSANAFVMHGGKPVFVDIDPSTMNVDVNEIEKSITPKTKAILVVHYAGVACDMQKIKKIASKYKIIIIEDNAHGLLAYYKNKPLGSIGDLATLSFHDTKNIHCGEGGALLINNKKFIKRAKILRDKGTNKYLFNKKISKKYWWVDLGSAFGLSEINAVFLYSQLIRAHKITNYRKKIFKIYYNNLKRLEKKKLIKLPFLPNYSKFNAHIFYIHVIGNRKKLINFLYKNSIVCASHYIPLHNSPFGKKKTRFVGDLKNTNKKSNTILRLPIYNDISTINVKTVIKKIEEYFYYI